MPYLHYQQRKRVIPNYDWKNTSLLWCVINASLYCKSLIPLLQCLEVAGLAEHAVVMWEDTTKFYKTSYLAWSAYADVLMYGEQVLSFATR